MPRTLRPTLLPLPLLMLIGGALAAQEPRTPHPEPGPGERVPVEGRIEMLVTRRARLGISVNLRSRESDTVGAYVQSVTPNGPAARAGIRSGDIVVRLNGQSLINTGVKSPREQSAPGLRLTELAARLDPGDSVFIEFRRGPERKTTTLVAGDEPLMTWNEPEGTSWSYSFGGDPDEAIRRMQRGLPAEPADGEPDDSGHRYMMRVPEFSPPPMMFMLGSPLADLELAPMNPDLGRYFGTSEGVLVISLPQESTLGLRGGDVVLSVAGRPLSGPAQLLRILRSYGPGEEIRFEILRMKRRETVTGQFR